MKVPLQTIRPYIKERHESPELNWPVIKIDPTVLPEYEVPGVEQ